MKKSLLIFSLTIMETFSLTAQIGINTDNPMTLFHIDGASNNTTSTEKSILDDVVIDKDGRLGIGTRTPNSQVKVDIAGGIGPTTNFKFTNNSMTKYDNFALISDKDGFARWDVIPKLKVIEVENVSDLLGARLITKNPSYMGVKIDLTKGSWQIMFQGTFQGTGNYPSSFDLCESRTSYELKDPLNRRVTSSSSSPQSVVAIYFVQVTEMTQTFYLWATRTSGYGQYLQGGAATMWALPIN